MGHILQKNPELASISVYCRDCEILMLLMFETLISGCIFSNSINILEILLLNIFISIPLKEYTSETKMLLTGSNTLKKQNVSITEIDPDTFDLTSVCLYSIGQNLTS